MKFKFFEKKMPKNSYNKDIENPINKIKSSYFMLVSKQHIRKYTKNNYLIYGPPIILI